MTPQTQGQHHSPSTSSVLAFSFIFETCQELWMVSPTVFPGDDDLQDFEKNYSQRQEKVVMPGVGSSNPLPPTNNNEWLRKQHCLLSSSPKASCSLWPLTFFLDLLSVLSKITQDIE
jgi:hypothetical protein